MTDAIANATLALTPYNRTATSRLKDATQLRMLPFLKVDPKLSKLLEQLTVLGSMIYACLDKAAVLAIKEELAAEFATGSSAHKELSNIIMKLEQVEGESTQSSAKETPIHHEVEIFLAVIRQTMLHMENCNSTLSDMEIQVRHFPLFDVLKAPLQEVQTSEQPLAERDH